MSFCSLGWGLLCWAVVCFGLSDTGAGAGAGAGEDVGAGTDEGVGAGGTTSVGTVAGNSVFGCSSSGGVT